MELLNRLPINKMNQGEAIKRAEKFLTDEGHRYGICLGAEVKLNYPRETWEVEFAYEGMQERSHTTDPPSIVIAVNEHRVSVASLM